MASDASLSLLSQTELGFKATSRFPVACPTLDLCAAWDDSDKNLLIYRPRGQIVSKIHQLGRPGIKAPDVVAVTWKPDGQFLAVGWSDGCVRLMGLETNKTVHQINVCEANEAKITHIGWADIVISKKASKSNPERLQALEQSGIQDAPAKMRDLPEELAFLEIDTALPKISPLPASSSGPGDDATVFTSRNGIEFLFQTPGTSSYDQVNAIIVGTNNGKLHLSVYDAFSIGSFTLPSLSIPGTPQLALHASSSQISTQALLVADGDPSPSELCLIPMDLPFASSSPINISLLTSKLTTLQTLLRYLKQTQLHMQTEWKNAQELPSRFLRSVQGDLEESDHGPRDVVSALYHTVITGHAYKPVSEWLVDVIGERNHKRWDKAVVSGLENLRNLVHENFLPALDRCAIILSRLRGFAQFYDEGDDIGFTATQINRVMDIVSCLSLVGHKILTHVMDELDHFQAFSTWMRFQIDRLVSRFSDELTEKEATLETSKVLTYIDKYLTESPLDNFFDQVAKEDYDADWQHIEDGPSLLHVLDRQLQRRQQGQPSMKALPHVEFLVDYATTWCNRIFKSIAEAKKRTVRFGKTLPISIGAPITAMDMKMSSIEQQGTILVAISSKEVAGKVFLFKTELSVVNGISTSQDMQSCCIETGRSVIDVKLLDVNTLMILCNASNNMCEIISVPLDSAALPYSNFTDISATASVAIDGLASNRFTLPAESTMRPVRMEVHAQRNVRGEIPDRVCLLGANRSTWRTFTMPGRD